MEIIEGTIGRLLSFYDKLSSIEQSWTPAGYRANLVGWLEDEERKFGKLDGAANAFTGFIIQCRQN